MNGLIRQLLFSLVMVLSVLGQGVADKGIQIKAKAVRKEVHKNPAGDVDEDWAYQIDLQSSSKRTIGPLVVQCRYWLYRELSDEGKPEGSLDSHESSREIEVIPALGKSSVEIGPLRFAGVSSPGGPKIRPDKDIFQGVRVRVWERGILIGEFTEEHTKAADEMWPLIPPPVPSGAEAGSGPWLLLTVEQQDFAGFKMGTPATEVVKRLRQIGGGEIRAKSEALHGHPFNMRATGLPGCAFGFNSDKKLTLIEVSAADRVKLPGGLILGKALSLDFENVFGKSKVETPHEAKVRQIAFGSLVLTLNDSETPTRLWLESSPGAPDSSSNHKESLP